MLESLSGPSEGWLSAHRPGQLSVFFCIAIPRETCLSGNAVALWMRPIIARLMGAF